MKLLKIKENDEKRNKERIEKGNEFRKGLGLC